LAVQSLWGERPREVVIENLRGLFHSLPKPGHDYVWAALTGLVCDFNIPELAPEARQAFAEGLVDETVLDLDWFEEAMAECGEQSAEHFRSRNEPIDAVNECSMWLCFRDESDDFGAVDDDDDIDRDEIPDDAFGPPSDYHVDMTPPVPYRAPPKVGRNEPCPCGSGKKHKKCCGR
jgi:hypothetical protein